MNRLYMAASTTRLQPNVYGWTLEASFMFQTGTPKLPIDHHIINHCSKIEVQIHIMFPVWLVAKAVE